MKISKGLKQAYDLQDLAYDAAMSLRQSLTKEDGTLKITREDAQAIALVVKAWETGQERIRIHRDKPLPGTRRPEKRSGKKRNKRQIEPELLDTGPSYNLQG